VIDEKTVRVPLKFPAATFLLNLASDYMKMYPKHVAENLSQDDMNCCPEKMIGSGPWMFKDWKRDASYSFERNPNYFKKGRPFFDGLEVFLILDNARRISALQTGQVFGTFQPVTGGNRPEDMVKLEQDTNGQVRAIIAENVSCQDLFLNITKPPFDDPRVRRAVYLGLDRREGVQRAVSGFGNPGSVFAPGTVEDMDELSQTLAYQEDRAAALTEAKRLLAETGYPDGFKATINTTNTEPSLPAAEVASAQLREDLGIDLTISSKDLATMYVDMRDGTHEITTVGTGIILTDPSDILNQFFDQDVLRNPHNWSNPRSNELMQLQDKTVDTQKRQALLQEFADIIHQGESHLVPYFWYSSGGAFDYRLRNFYPPPTIQIVHKWDHIWFDEDRQMPEAEGYVP
jgi:peptide/nickel transport system substrate-binding protein